MDESTRRRCSVLLYDALNHLGYSSYRIKHRSKFVSRIFQPKNNGMSHLNTIFAGSFGEGISKIFSSDVDVMISLCDIMCVDVTSHENQPSGLTFQNEYSNTFPGYVRIQTDCDVSESILRTSRSIDTGKHYLNNQLTLQEFQMSGLPPGMINGPALTANWSLEWLPEFASKTLFERPVEGDMVLALPFFSATLLEKWLSRTRYHEWPSRRLQRKISQMVGYVVPVGHKFSTHKDIEWRISYTTAEKKLVLSMNDVQVKVYVVMKHIQKDRLKSVCKNFSSYMVKNLVFWSLEMTPTGDFTPETLVDRILSAFCYLKQCLENKFLPCYMIPERNLLHGRIDERECIILLREVENIINEGYEFLLKNHKLSLSMQLTHSYPEIARDYAQWLVEIEDFYLLLMERENALSGQDVLRHDDDAIFVRLVELLDLDFLNVLLMAERNGVNEVLDLLLTRLADALS